MLLISLIASFLDLQILTPLPAARPSDFTTIGKLNLFITSSTCSILFTNSYFADGIENSLQI